LPVRAGTRESETSEQVLAPLTSADFGALLRCKCSPGHQPGCALHLAAHPKPQRQLSARETLIDSSGQAGFAVLDAVQGANHSNSRAIAADLQRSNAPKSANGSGARN